MEEEMLLSLMANPYNMKPKKEYHRKNYLSMYLSDRYDERDERVVRFIESRIDDLIVEYVLNDIIDQIKIVIN
jgi:hypothetical protein